jgi:hypothetical protein
MTTLFAAIVSAGLLIVLIPATPAAAACAEPAACAAAAGLSSGGSAAALDVRTLETRLRDTRAIGLFTKLSLKHQVDDLLDQFREFHDGRGAAPLPRLRERFDGLLFKVLSLLADGDRPLAADLIASRERLWTLLANPRTFATLRARGKAGA